MLSINEICWFYQGFLAPAGLFPYLYAPIKQVNMDLTNLEKQLRFTVPEEFYDIAPGEVAYFIPLKGISLTELDKILVINYYLNELHKDVVQFTLVPTGNVSLIDMFAGRGFQEVNTPYSVILGNRETIAGFASQFFGDDIEDVVQATISYSIRRKLSINSENKPIVVEIDPKFRPVKASTVIDGYSSDDPGMELLQKRPETEKEKKDLVAKYEQKFRKMLWECAYLGIDLNINGIVEEVEINKTKTAEKFDAKNEEASIGMNNFRNVSSTIINSLYLKANVKDNRYKFF